ncbi:MAG: hypothetical protein IPJ61_18395 [Tessaracoccus sp.]|uniref:hypothetical protein n=1 Tax=Tessaracoccus sp. TaxID=1971211 RepID=UPI001EC6C96F|nr:hypothetical protein [Tessaracoccus sp.]MBK7822955.1 hypothetical protein [Tessaracoccus sp.]
MTDDDIAMLRDHANRLSVLGSPFVAAAIAALLAEVGHWKSEAKSWEKQASDRTDDALRFAAERDVLARNAAYWKEEARRYCENADFWRSKFEVAAMKGASNES